MPGEMTHNKITVASVPSDQGARDWILPADIFYLSPRLVQVHRRFVAPVAAFGWLSRLGILMVATSGRSRDAADAGGRYQRSTR